MSSFGFVLNQVFNMLVVREFDICVCVCVRALVTYIIIFGHMDVGVKDRQL